MIARKFWKAALAAAAMLAWAAGGNAQVISYHPSADPWIAAVAATGATYAVETFDSAATLHPDILSIVGDDVEIGVAPTNVFAGSPPVLRGVVDGESVITFNFARPMIAFGANWDLFNPGGPGSQITLTLVGGGVHVIENWLSNTDSGQFSGIVSEVAFTSFVLSEGSNPLGGQETFEMDNLKFAAAIPEPETYAMLLAGLGLMGFVARRRRQNLAAA